MRVIIAAAGTGGHINPGIAIADKIKKEQPGSEIIFIGTNRGLENDLVPRAGYKLKTIEAYGVLSEWEKKLNSDSFFCPCRGYLVNLNRIHFIKDNELIMSNNEKIPLSRRQEKELRSIFSKKLLSINQVR